MLTVCSNAFITDVFDVAARPAADVDMVVAMRFCHLARIAAELLRQQGPSHRTLPFLAFSGMFAQLMW